LSDKKRQSEADETASDEVAPYIAEAVSGKLKAYYDSVTGQAIPDRFMDLLAQLDASASKTGKPNGR
jgi:hypothetical protein